ncbi:MAG: hypothetical protein ACK4VI_06650 [Alphaproteobacteria bacterium]
MLGLIERLEREKLLLAERAAQCVRRRDAWRKLSNWPCLFLGNKAPVFYCGFLCMIWGVVGDLVKEFRMRNIRYKNMFALGVVIAVLGVMLLLQGTDSKKNEFLYVPQSILDALPDSEGRVLIADLHPTSWQYVCVAEPLSVGVGVLKNTEYLKKKFGIDPARSIKFLNRRPVVDDRRWGFLFYYPPDGLEFLSVDISKFHYAGTSEIPETESYPYCLDNEGASIKISVAQKSEYFISVRPLKEGAKK